ncbi:MAG: putative phage abortive infection protein [Roseovarius sp.]|nr:putative phage abortive infection protein [Roseovarius sp.]
MKHSEHKPLYKQPVVLVGAILTLAIILAFGISLAFGEVCAWYGSCESKWNYLVGATPNEIGDSLAGFAGSLAFIWIVVTVWLQATELSEQRDVLKDHKTEFAAQNKSLKEQIFENTFFQMLSSLGEIIEAIDLAGANGNTTGRDCFKVYYERLRKRNHGTTGGDLTFVVEEFFAKYGHEFGHYFRFLYNFYRYIDESGHTKKHHVKVLRSYISDYELLLLFYNGQTVAGQNFCKYFEKYAVFDNLPCAKLMKPEHLTNYSTKAYGGNNHALQWLESP